MTLPIPAPALSGVFVGCNNWIWDCNLADATTIAQDRGLSAEDLGSIVYFLDGAGETVAYWRPLND